MRSDGGPESVVLQRTQVLLTMHDDTLQYTGREGRLHLDGYENSLLRPIRSVCLALLLSQAAPACFFPDTGPRDGIRTPVRIASRAETAPGEGLDLFFFEAEEPGLLDACEHVDAIPARWEGRSRSGEKILAAVANADGAAFSWNDIRSFRNFSEKTVALGTEDPDAPVMTATAPLTAGRPVSLTLQPLLAEIRVHSLCCDFHARSYAGARLENVRIYLTNVCDRCRLDGESVPSWLNAGRLDPSGTAALRYPEMVLQTLDGPVGDVTVFPDIRLYAYPNPSEEDALGTPFTRLVIEGTLLGETCYYPLSVFPMEGGRSHVFDITLTRFGTADPDIPATRDQVRLSGAVAPWNGMDPLIQRF